MSITDTSSSLLVQIPISNEEFQQITSLIYDTFGITLSEEKRSLVMGRLQKYLRKNNYNSYSQYIDQLKTGNNLEALSALIDNISTNHTFFWREHEHFDHLFKSALPEITGRQEKLGKDLRIWCAGCSTGEEAYTLMALIMHYLEKDYSNWKAGLLATDISEKVLNLAMVGKYSEEQLNALPTKLKNSFFKKAGNDTWQVIDKIKKEITFRRFNLMNKEYPFKKQFQVIFCRNVMIYFDVPTKDRVIKNFIDFLEPGGYLYIGHSESLGRNQSELDYVMPSVYRKR